MTDVKRQLTPAEAPPEPTEPFRKNGDGGGQKVCSRCQAVNVPEAERCRCGAVLLRNQFTRKDGVYARQQPAAVLMTADDLLAGVLSDQGGTDQMSTIQRSLASKLRDTDILCALNKNAIVADGMKTPEGRRAHDRYLAAVDRFIRLAMLIGLERRQKRVDLARALSGMDK